jgi:mannosyltransferase OCH1-like enzyme
MVWEKKQFNCLFNVPINTIMQTIDRKDITEFKLLKSVKNRTIGQAQLIPYIIHQTNENDMLPSDMAMGIDTIIEKNP